MKILLDTNVLLWLITGNKRADSIVAEIENTQNEVYFSSASIWEIAIKKQIEKLNIDPADAAFEFEKAGFAELPIRSSHAAAVLNLPLKAEHKDPFDRLLLAQAASEQMLFITGDEKIAGYTEAVVKLI